LIFKFRIYDKHETITFIDNLISVTPFDDWVTFTFILDVNELRITAFRSYVLFTEDNTPIECTKVFLNDGSFVFATNKIDTFEKNYRENYLNLFEVLKLSANE
jgi:hypothetical protein